MIEYVRIDPQSLYNERMHLLWKAFVPGQGLEKAIELYHSLLDNQAIFTAQDDGRLAAMICVKEPIENRIRGANLSFGGIGEVSTLPEYRRDRLIRTIFSRVFAYMNEQDIVYSALGPFSFTFYEKFGYVHAAQNMRYTFPTAFLKPVRGDSAISYREYADEDGEGVMKVQRSMARFGSRVFIPVKKLKSDHAYVFERAGQIIGFTRFGFKRLGEYETGIEVSDTWFSQDECLPAIVDMVYRYASQSPTTIWHIDNEIPLEYYLTEPGKTERKREGYMMVRVVKFREFCQQIKVPLYAAEPVVIALKDESCPWNTGTFKLTPVSGRLEVEPSNKEPEIHFDAQHFSHAVGGFLTANRLHRLGGLDCSASAAERFTRIFPSESYVSYVTF